MAYEQIHTSLTGLEAGSDMSADQHHLVVLSSGQVALAGAAARAIGVLLNKPAAAGRAAQVQDAGIARVIASAAISQGDDVGCAASGEARTATTGDHIIGEALEAAGGADEIISVLLVYKGTAA